ncbi:protein preY, mitochondrial [Phascolarctos cinereus]|uniref:Protein preY, mitochondrial n=1 Tax=Phascolarctos cinereus TaxID=38626 RepID=A0A6P5KEE4_PHACI|nr:protein preY, mitochondrial [Phascolarctos cinereus]
MATIPSHGHACCFCEKYEFMDTSLVLSAKRACAGAAFLHAPEGAGGWGLASSAEPERARERGSRGFPAAGRAMLSGPWRRAASALRASAAGSRAVHAAGPRPAADSPESGPASPPAAFDAALLDVLVCPLSKKPLRYEVSTNELINEELGIAYPVIDGIPNMIPQAARKIHIHQNKQQEEKEQE